MNQKHKSQNSLEEIKVESQIIKEEQKDVLYEKNQYQAEIGFYEKAVLLIVSTFYAILTVPLSYFSLPLLHCNLCWLGTI